MFNRTYDGAPNPTIFAGGHGLLGLPLNKLEADSLRTHCSQAPFGQGERTLIDTNVRDTWEMDGSQV
jgi:hypothetical protein